MKKIISFSLILLALFLIVLVGCSSTKKANPPQTMHFVNVPAYMGKWYEIASVPNYFQKGCRCTQAAYTLMGDYVSVKNSCFKASSDKRKIATAKTTVVDRSGNAKFKIQFFWPFKADYWILYVSSDYQYAVVGTPDRKYFWILARKAQINSEKLAYLIQIANTQGYAINKIQYTDQSCQATQ